MLFAAAEHVVDAPPVTTNQLPYLNDLGCTPAEITTLNKWSASSTIHDQGPKLQHFKDTHHGDRWCTGRQRQCLLEKGKPKHGACWDHLSPY